MSLYYKYNPLGLGNVQPPVVNVRGVFLQSNSILVSSAMTVRDCTLASGASADLMDIYNYGKAVSCTISSGGIANVSSGGSATKTTVERNGNMIVSSGGEVTTVVINSGGLFTASYGGQANDIRPQSGGQADILSGAVVTTVLCNGILNAKGGYINTVSNFANTYVSGGVVATLTNMTDTAEVYVTSGGVINGCSGGICHVTGGTVNNITANAPLTVESNGYVGSAYISGALTVSNGFVSSAHMGGSASAVALSGGSIKGVLFYSGGSLLISSGGLGEVVDTWRSSYIDLKSGGTLIIKYALNTLVTEPGAYIIVDSTDRWAVKRGETYYNMYVTNRAMLDISGTVYGITVDKSSWLSIENGGVVTDCIADSGTYINVGAGCSLTSAFFSGSRLWAEGTCSDITVAQGRLVVSSNGLVSNSLVDSSAYAQVMSGGVYSAPTILSGGNLNVSSGGSAMEVVAESGAVITSNEGATITYAEPIAGSQGVFTSSGSTAVSSAMIMRGGTIGTGYEATNMNVYSRGRVLDTNIATEGIATIGTGGIMSGCTVSGMAGETTHPRILVSSGGAAIGITYVDFGYANVYSGGLANDNVISSGGHFYVRDGGVAINTTVRSGGNMTVSSGGEASNTIVSSGGFMSIASGGAALNTTSSGGVVTYVNGGTVTYSGTDDVYGVEYDPSNSSPVCQRIVLRNGTVTNVSSFAGLPAHNWHRCVMDNLATRHINYYLDPFDSTKKLDQTAADLTGADGDVMVEIPVVHWRVDELENGHIRWLVSDHAFDGSEVHPFFYVSPNGDTVRTQYVGAYDATICDANGDRIANMMNEAATSSTAYNAAYKLRSVAGCKPFTSTTLGRLRTTARNNGGEVCNSLFYQFLGLMMLIEGASLNTQATISEGFTYAYAWSFAYLRLAGRVNAGNGTAEALADATQDAAITWRADHPRHVIAFQYRGIENPYGAASQFEEGIQKWDDGSSNPSTACYWWTAATNNYTDTDQNAASSPTYTKTLHAWPRANGMPQTFDPRSFLPLTVGASTSTYMCDGYGYDNATGSRILLRGGATGNTYNAGAWYVYAAYALNGGTFQVNGARISA